MHVHNNHAFDLLFLKGFFMKTAYHFPMTIQFLDTKKMKSIFSYEQLKKHMAQPIIVLQMQNTMW